MTKVEIVKEKCIDVFDVNENYSYFSLFSLDYKYYVRNIVIAINIKTKDMHISFTIDTLLQDCSVNFCELLKKYNIQDNDKFYHCKIDRKNSLIYKNYYNALVVTAIAPIDNQLWIESTIEDRIDDCYDNIMNIIDKQLMRIKISDDLDIIIIDDDYDDDDYDYDNDE
ncbi:MAG: hypothetical protein PVJ67_03830 [Candidatus Pacearchaeota archaeon]|jgi:hypothetical protein